MNLSDKEQKLVDQITKRNHTWQKYRLLCLIVCLAGIFAWLFFFFFSAELYQNNPYFYASLYFTVIPLAVFNCGLCSIILGKVIRDWNGNAVDTLLLKILETLDKKNEP